MFGLHQHHLAFDVTFLLQLINRLATVWHSETTVSVALPLKILPYCQSQMKMEVYMKHLHLEFSYFQYMFIHTVSSDYVFNLSLKWNVLLLLYGSCQLLLNETSWILIYIIISGWINILLQKYSELHFMNCVCLSSCYDWDQQDSL